MKLFPILLIGSISMFTGEVLAGSSQTWFINPFSLLLTFPLYLVHVLLLLHLALKSNKTSLSQLYFFGAIFGLYEAFITKVLWAGYVGGGGIELGSLLGIKISEFVVLVLFWHPVMSFILPILLYQILTKQVITEHVNILKKTPLKNKIIIIFAILIGSFIAAGNQFNFISVIASIMGSAIIILALHYFSKTNLKIFEFTKFGFLGICIFLGLFYWITYFKLLPERIPSSWTPLISIFVVYAVFILIISISPKLPGKMISLDSNQFQNKDITKFFLITFIAANVMCFAPGINMMILGIAYYAMMLAGVAIFFFFLIPLFIKKSFKQF